MRSLSEHPPGATLVDKGYLVQAVKLAETYEYVGKHGGWKDFVKASGKAVKADPSSTFRFLESLTGYKQHKALRRLERWYKQVTQEQAEHVGQPVALNASEHELQPAAKKRKLSGSNTAAHASQAAAADAAELPATEASVMNGASAWELVQYTEAHELYQHHYGALPSWERGWKRQCRVAHGPATQPTLIGLDCEMVGSTSDSRELVKLAVVDSAGKLLCQELVKPRKRVLDHRTAITGLTREHLKGVKVRRQDAQEQVLQLLSQHAPAILVGHALHNDLRALRLDVHPVIDTSKLFKYRGLSSYSPRLSDLARDVLGRQLRADEAQPHDCATDAAAAVALAQHAMLHGCREPLQPPTLKASQEEQCMLLLHGLPADLPSSQVQERLPKAHRQALRTCITWRPLPGKPRHMHLLFPTPQAAHSAFKGLPGACEKDVMGRMQKALALNRGPMVKIREMAADQGRIFGKDAYGQPPRALRRK